ncbi:hypothetical protein QTP86_034719, partial [Hemibagrus guttatus]
MAAEANYDVGNRELPSIKAALEEWRHWLEGARHPFQVLTNHHNLEYLRGAKRLNPWQARVAVHVVLKNCPPRQVGGVRNRSETRGGSTGPDGKVKGSHMMSTTERRRRATSTAEQQSRATSTAEPQGRAMSTAEPQRRAPAPRDVHRRTPALELGTPQGAG